MTSRARAGAVLAAAATGLGLALAPTTAGAAPEGSPEDRSGSSDQREQPAPVTGESANDRYIVVFSQGVRANSMGSAKASARSQGARISHEYDRVLDGFAAKLPPQAMKGLRNNPNVEYIEPVRKVTTADTESPATWGLDRIDQRDLPLDDSYTFEESGSGVTAYVIDTGIAAGHEEFSGRVSSGFTAIEDGRGTEDCNGHGTHVAGTVGGETYGVAQDVDLVAVRVLGCQGGGTTAGVIDGVDWVTQDADGPAVANMSLGGGSSAALDTAVENSIAGGVTYALAAGNDYGADACGGSPGRVDAGLTVGSSTEADAVSDFSNLGSCLDLFAPGSEITSAWIGGSSATNTISGTSMATPHVAGAAALRLEADPGASPAAVADHLVSTATTDVLTGIGSGSPNRLLFTGDATGGLTGLP